MSMIGRTLAHYRVVGKLGEGGMGEVYRATDLKLGRDVALKILPDRFSADETRVSRFRREAQLLASLNHPNIAAIYGVEEEGGHQALVLELVEGPTLDDRIRGGAIPVSEALAIARQIALALEAAHERGVVHRDLKPANIKLTPGGQVKVLDFGIARALVDDETRRETTGGTTVLARDLTRIGIKLGTPSYMSPEQTRGAAVDTRTDIWSFGCVLFEMFTGRRAFDAGTDSDIQAAALRDDPPWQTLPVELPPAVARVLRRCLEKDPRNRMRDIADARFALEDPLDTGTGVWPLTTATLRAGRPAWPRLARTAAVLLSGALIGAAAIWVSRPSAPDVAAPTSRFALDFSSIEIGPGTQGPGLAISPDGRRIAITGSDGGPMRLYLRPLDALHPIAMAGTDGAMRPFFSPDGDWIAFFAARKLKKVSVRGGEPVAIADISDEPRGGAWGPDGTILVGQSTARLARVSAEGGTVDFVGPAESEPGLSHRFPEWLPGGKAILYTRVRDNQFDIVAHSFESGTDKVIVRGGTQPKFIATGHLVYAQQVSTDATNLFSGALFSVPFDPVRLEATGAAQPIEEGVFVQAGGAANFSVARNATLVYLPGDRYEPKRLVWVDREGRSRTLLETPRVYNKPRLSPDGSRLVVSVRDGERGLWSYSVTNGAWQRLPMPPGEDATPVWSPDGLRLAFSSDESGQAWVQGLDRVSSKTPLATPKQHQHLDSWSPDGRTLIFTLFDSATTGLDLWKLDLQSGAAAEPWLQTPAGESNARFSPDGRWVAYQSNESGRVEVYVRPFPGPGERVKISTAGGQMPVWTRGGKELCYRQGQAILAVDITTSPAFSASAPAMLFRTRHTGEFEPAADGSGFVMLASSEEHLTEQQLVVVLDWFTELRRRMLGR